MACHPLDTIKSKMQATSRGSVTTCISDTLKKEGARGFYRGLGAATIIGVPAGALYFTSYEAFKRRFRRRAGVAPARGRRRRGRGVCGFCAGGRGQGTVPGPQLYIVVRLLPYCAKKEGPRATSEATRRRLWSFGAFSGLYWAFYEQLRPSDTSVSFADALPCALRRRAPRRRG